MSNISHILEVGASGRLLSMEELSELEEVIRSCDRAYASGKAEVEDSVYDTLKELLKTNSPDNELLSQTWEESWSADAPAQSSGDSERTAKFREALSTWGKFLKEDPMMSITTIKTYEDQELWDWINCLDQEGDSVFLSYKINGHGIRVVYDNGELVSATTRARGGRGIDITDEVKMILGESNPDLEDLGLCEVRGELCLKLDKLDEAREYNPKIKSALSAISSLRAARNEYTELLDFLAYNIYADGLEFDFKSDEYNFLEEKGFITPEYMSLELSSEDLSSSEAVLAAIQDAMQTMEEGYDEFGYFCDGVVAQIDSNEEFSEAGSDGHANLGNVALKVGLWKQIGYTGRVVGIEWKPGTTKLSPVVTVEGLDDTAEAKTGVLVSQGNRVAHIPIYNPLNILLLGIQVGSMLHFNYGGESGVIPVKENGSPVSEDKAGERLEQWFDEN